MRLAATLAAIAALAGPAAAQTPAALAAFQTPAAGAEGVAEVGQPLVSAGKVAKIPVLELLAPAQARAMGNLVILEPGRFVLERETAAGRFYRAQGPITLRALGISMPWQDGGVLIPPGGKPPELYWRNGYGGLAKGAAPNLAYELREIESLEHGGFRRELVYSGVSRGVVTLQYREFSNELARPAFTQQLTYDLAEGDEIGFGGARLKILKATNTEVRYQVLKPLAPLPQ